MKSILSLLLAFVMCFSLAGCGSSEPPAPTPINSGDDFIEVAASIPFLQARLTGPESMQIYSDIDVIELNDVLKVFCFTFGADFVPDVYTKAVEAEIYTDGQNCLACWENEESFIGWRDSIAYLAAEGYSIKTIDGKKVATQWGIEYLTLAELEAQEEAIEAECLELDDLKVLDYGYFINNNILCFCPIVENTGDKLYLYPEFNIKAYNESGETIVEQECLGSSIFPAQKMAFYIEVCELSELPASISYEINCPESCPVMDYPNSIYSEFVPFEIIQADLENNFLKVCLKDYNSLIGFYSSVCVFYDADGSICWATSDYAMSHLDKDIHSFSVNVYCPIKYESFELFLNRY